MECPTESTCKRSLSIYGAEEDGKSFKRPFAEQEFYYQSAEPAPMNVYDKISNSDEEAEEEDEELPVFKYISTVQKTSGLRAVDGLKKDYTLEFVQTTENKDRALQERQQLQQLQVPQQPLRECFLEDIENELPLTAIIPSISPVETELLETTTIGSHHTNNTGDLNFSKTPTVDHPFVETRSVAQICDNQANDDGNIEKYFEPNLFSKLDGSGCDDVEDSESSSNTDTDTLYPAAAVLGVPLSGFRDRNRASRSGAPQKPFMNKKNVIRALAHGRTFA